MKVELKVNSVNQIIRKMPIYESGDPIESLALVVKGKISLEGNGIKQTVGSGYFLGLLDLEKSTHSITYTAETDSVVYAFPVQGGYQDIAKIQGVKKDYGMLMVSGLTKNIVEAAKLYQKLDEISKETFYFTSRSYRKLQSMAAKAGVDFGNIANFDKLEPFSLDTKVDLEQLSYFLACSKVSREVQAAYFGTSPDITTYQVKSQLAMIRQLQNICFQYTEALNRILELLIQGNKNLFRFGADLAATLQRMGEPNSDALSEMDEIIDRINQVETMLVERLGVPVEIDRDTMEQTYFELLNVGQDAGVQAINTADDMLALVEEPAMEMQIVEDVLETLMDYAQMDEEDAQKFQNLLKQFAALPDKLSTEDSVRSLRREIVKMYYPLYHSIFIKDYESAEKTPVVVDLFLRYGLISETLVDMETVEELLQIRDVSSANSFCQVYDMKEWLTAILKGEKEPSKNEFDMNYDEFLRDEKKHGNISQDEMNALKKDTREKMEFEINNMFRNNHRLVSGQITTFVPFLFKENMGNSLLNVFMSKDKINGAVNRIRRIDYSVFYRSSLYKTQDLMFQKEYIQEEVGPDILVFPGYGTKGIMWQELSGPYRNSRGRFLFPSFFEGDLDRTMIQVLGGFRWELCRTMQGVYWNNIQIKSLTSEYSDFLQFYRKNKELSEDRKEKLKIQIQKFRNNNREIFASDYDSWIRQEAKGGMVLSKPVREIMATYCPFNREIRESMESQPMFRDASARFNREVAKKKHEYDLKARIWEKDRVEVPEIILETKRFYEEF